MHNKNASVLFCLRTTIQIIQELNGLFLIPKHSYIIYNIQALASCTTSVYVNLSKNSFFLCYHPKKSAKADAKVHTFLIPTKFFGNFFSKNMKVFGIIYKVSILHLINIYKITQKSPRFRCH
jgi:hypothetical protein